MVLVPHSITLETHNIIPNAGISLYYHATYLDEREILSVR